MIIKRYCDTAPTKVDRCQRAEVIRLSSNRSRYLKFKLFNDCDGEKETSTIPEITVTQYRYNPRPNLMMLNYYKPSHVKFTGIFQYAVYTPDKTMLRQGSLTLNTDNTFNVKLDGLENGYYYLYIYYKTKYSENSYDFPLVVSG